MSTEVGVTETEEALAVSNESTDLLALFTFVSHAAAQVVAGHRLAADSGTPYDTAPGDDLLADLDAYRRARAAGIAHHGAA